LLLEIFIKPITITELEQKMRKIFATFCGVLTVAFITGCGNASSQNETWIPNPQYTGEEYLALLDSLSYDSDGNPLYGEINRQYRSELMFKKDADIVESEFVKAVMERYNMMSFKRYLNSELQIIDRTAGEDEEYRAEIDLSSEEMRLLVLGSDMSNHIKSAETYLSKEDFDNFWEEIQVVLNSPYTTEEPLSDKELDEFQNGFDKYYDKSVYVKDIERFYRARITDSDSLEVNASELLKRLPSTSDFDTRCILALEYSKTRMDETGAIQWLGDLLESGEYSKYLYEVWMQWKYSVQAIYFGVSTYSIIPDMYFEKVRNVVLNTMLRHIQNNPDDLGAKAFAFNIAVEMNLDRAAGVFGNVSLNYSYLLCHSLFLPENVVGKYSEE